MKHAGNTLHHDPEGRLKTWHNEWFASISVIRRAFVNLQNIFKMCCGNSKQEHGSIERANPITSKLGQCRLCMFLSFSGMVLSIAALLLISGSSSFLYWARFCIAVAATGFTALSAVHMFFYIKRSRPGKVEVSESATPNAIL